MQCFFIAHYFLQFVILFVSLYKSIIYFINNINICKSADIEASMGYSNVKIVFSLCNLFIKLMQISANSSLHFVF